MRARRPGGSGPLPRRVQGLPENPLMSHRFRAGFYCANTVSLSFGTLAVNDVVAAAVTVGFVEVHSLLDGQYNRILCALDLLRRHDHDARNERHVTLEHTGPASCILHQARVARLALALANLTMPDA